MSSPEYFGEVKVHKNDTEDYSPFEIRCDTDCVIARLGAIDAVRIFLTILVYATAKADRRFRF